MFNSQGVLDNRVLINVIDSGKNLAEKDNLEYYLKEIVNICLYGIYK